MGKGVSCLAFTWSGSHDHTTDQSYRLQNIILFYSSLRLNATCDSQHNLGIFMTLVYSSPNTLRAHWILRSLSNMYDRFFSREPCVTLVYSELQGNLEPCQIFLLENFVYNLA